MLRVDSCLVYLSVKSMSSSIPMLLSLLFSFSLKEPSSKCKVSAPPTSDQQIESFAISWLGWTPRVRTGRLAGHPHLFLPRRRLGSRPCFAAFEHALFTDETLTFDHSSRCETIPCTCLAVASGCAMRRAATASSNAKSSAESIAPSTRSTGHSA